ncbi:MAG: Gfo/Idh/MocA family oxidoreductase [Bryobacterales bacterium]|nr:Gfo/Idh/MocA family oxidoreductase [Bryobacterales bacterium]
MHPRRTFLLGAAAGVLAGQANDRIRLGVIGSGGRGTFVMTVFQKEPNTQVGAIADVYEPHLENALSVASKGQGGVAAKAYRNYKELLADKSIDAVLIATPEHWHHRMLLDALAAGKDVYIEKPLCRTPAEGVELMRAERNTKQVIQVGMQRRSYDLYLEGRNLVAAGKLGKIRMVRSWWLNNYLGSGAPSKARIEGALDWEQWQGPIAKRVPVDAVLFHNWRNRKDYAGGIVADQGAHVFDGIHLLMGASFPVAVTAAAGKPHKEGFDTPESVVATAEYSEDFIASFSINYAAMKYKSRFDQLNHLDGDQARMDIGRESLKIFAQGEEEKPVIERASARGFGYATTLHVQNFLSCVRSRQRPTATVALAFQAALVAQMANLSLQSGRRVRWNREMERTETV